MNILFAKNNTKKTLIVNDIPKMPHISPGETVNLLEFATAAELKNSKILQTLFDKKFLIEVVPKTEEPEIEEPEIEEEYEEILDENGKIKNEFMPEQIHELFLHFDKLVDHIKKDKEETKVVVDTMSDTFQKSIQNLTTLTKQQFQHYDTMISQVAAKDPQMVDTAKLTQQMSDMVDDKIKAAVTKSSQVVVTKMLEKILPSIKENEAKIESLSNDAVMNIPQLKNNILDKTCKGMNLKNISPGELKQIVELIVFVRKETDFKVKNININFELA